VAKRQASGRTNIVERAVAANPLFFALALPFFTDATFTLLGQGPSYWRDHRLADEVSPSYFFLAIHPVAYIAMAMIGSALLYWLVRHLREPLNIMLALAFVGGSTWGSSTWLQPRFEKVLSSGVIYQEALLFGWGLLTIYFALVGILAGFCFVLYMQQRADSGPGKEPKCADIH
jgi:hypothetical protein